MVDYSRADVKSAVTDMMNYFGRKAVPNIVDMYIDAMLDYPENIVRKTIYHFIHNNDKMPKIHELKWYIENTHGIVKQKQYDPEDDPDYPLYLLEQGLQVLERNNGNEQAFIAFADRVRMPRQDRARVLGKYRRCYRVGEKLKTVGKI